MFNYLKIIKYKMVGEYSSILKYATWSTFFYISNVKKIVPYSINSKTTNNKIFNTEFK